MGVRPRGFVGDHRGCDRWAPSWMRLYNQGRSPKEPAEQAAVSGYNTHLAFERMREKKP
jgi:hypothetical protein